MDISDVDFLKCLRKTSCVKTIGEPDGSDTHKRLFSSYTIVFADGSEKTLRGVALCSIHDKPAAHFLDKDLNTVFVVSYHAMKYIYEKDYA